MGITTAESNEQYENYTVRITVSYETVVCCKKSELEEKIFDLPIPENRGMQYVDESWKVNSVETEHGRAVKLSCTE